MSTTVPLFDFRALIELVESFPCLWDKRRDSYTSKYAKQEAWNSICNILFIDYAAMDKQAKILAMSAVKSKWNNIRDYFVKTIKKHGKLSKRRYMHHDRLTFLLKAERSPTNPSTSKIVENQELTDDSNEYPEQASTETPFEDPGGSEIVEYPEPTDNSKEYPEQTSTDTPLTDPSTSEMVEYQEPTNNSNEYLGRARTDTPLLTKGRKNKKTTLNADANDDIAFFESLLPEVREMSEDAKYDFRIEVLQMVKRYRQGASGSLYGDVSVPHVCYSSASSSANSRQSEDYDSKASPEFGFVTLKDYVNTQEENNTIVKKESIPGTEEQSDPIIKKEF